jgi:hypothetical protein
MHDCRKLTVEQLKALILNEQQKMKSFGAIKTTEKVAKETSEVTASGFAKHLSKHTDYIKALKIKESRLLSQLKDIRRNLNELQGE